MTKPFTAKEVRDAQDWLQAEADMSPDEDQCRGLIRVRKMIHAFADRIEADEKAEAVMWSRTVNGLICITDDHLFAGKWKDAGFAVTPYYTRPSPSNAERLAEALRAKVRQLRNMPKGEFQLAGSVFANDLEHILDGHHVRGEQ